MLGLYTPLYRDHSPAPAPPPLFPTMGCRPSRHRRAASPTTRDDSKTHREHPTPAGNQSQEGPPAYADAAVATASSTAKCILFWSPAGALYMPEHMVDTKAGLEARTLACFADGKIAKLTRVTLHGYKEGVYPPLVHLVGKCGGLHRRTLYTRVSDVPSEHREIQQCTSAVEILKLGNPMGDKLRRDRKAVGL